MQTPTNLRSKWVYIDKFNQCVSSNNQWKSLPMFLSLVCYNIILIQMLLIKKCLHVLFTYFLFIWTDLNLQQPTQSKKELSECECVPDHHCADTECVSCVKNTVCKPGEKISKSGKYFTYCVLYDWAILNYKGNSMHLTMRKKGGTINWVLTKPNTHLWLHTSWLNINLKLRSQQ